MVGGISVGVAGPLPGNAYGAEQVDAIQTDHKRWSQLCDFVIFRKRNSLLSHFDHILHVFEAI